MEGEQLRALRDMKDRKEPVEIALPKEVEEILGRFRAQGFEAYVVGGCLRDVMLGHKPKDWDIATNAAPEKMLEMFGEDAFYENQFGTVGIKTDTETPELTVIEATTYRKEGRYTDKRHPDSISPAETLEEDLARRDFTVNAMAYDGRHLIDPFSGSDDLQAKLIRAVGNPYERFSEDALRLFRAVRLAANLGFRIESETEKALLARNRELALISKERVQDEFKKLLSGPAPDRGIEMLRETKLLAHVLPELEEGWGVTQNKHHIYTVWEHNLRALQYAADQGYAMPIRLAALLHDVGKPRTKRGEGPDATFYGHQVVGARMAVRAMERLRFSKNDIEEVSGLVRHHMFKYDPQTDTPASIRRIIARVGKERIHDLIAVRKADRAGSGVRDVSWRVEELEVAVEKALAKFVSRSDMAVNGHDLMEALKLQAGPRLGAILDALFEEVLDEAEGENRNMREYLLRRAGELNELSDDSLEALRAKAKEKYRAVLEEEEEAIAQSVRAKYRGK